MLNYSDDHSATRHQPTRPTRSPASPVHPPPAHSPPAHSLTRSPAMLSPTRRNEFILFGLIALLAALMTLPTVRWLANEWWSNDYYSHGVLVPLISAFFAWRIWPRIEPHPDNLGLALLAAALLAYLIALFQRAYFLAALSIIPILGGMIWYLWGRRALRQLAFPLGFLLFMIPLPFVEASSLPMALFTGKLSTQVMQALGMDIIVNGTAVTLPNANLVVGAQCSGLRSLVAMATLVAIFAYMIDGSWPVRLLLVLAAAPIAVLGNMMRVSTLLWVANRWGVDAAFDFYHNYSGILFFLFAFLCLILLAWTLGSRNIRDDIL